MSSLTQKLLKIKGIPFLLRLITLLFFIFILFLSYFGMMKIIEPNDKIALFVVWTLWWPFLYITLLFFARAWCGFLCPISLFNELGNKIKKGKTINIIKWGFIPFILFFFIVLTEQIYGLFLSLNLTLIFFMAFITAAFIFGILFTRWGFCRFLCPIGTLLSVFSRLSFIGLRTKEEKCRKCHTRECMKGSIAEPCPLFNNIPTIKTNKDCLLCANCIKNCPYDSADIKLLSPSKEVIDEINFTKAESLFIIAVMGLTFTLNARGIGFFRNMVPMDITGGLLRTVDFVLAIGLTLFAFGMLFYILDKKEGLRRSGYIYLPLVFSIMFFTIIFGFLGPYVNLSENFIAISKYIVLFIGMGWSFYFTFRLMRNRKMPNTIIHFAAILLVVLFWAFYLISGPLNLFPETESVVIAEPGKTIRMNSFSMGFIPDVIIAKKGQEIILDINNKDIVHAFDIDEFEVHRVLLSGARSTIIKFTPDKTGEFRYYCNIPGHTEAGMKGKLIVEE